MTEWLQADQENRNYYEDLRKVWDTSLQLGAVSTVDENEAWQRFRKRIRSGETGLKTQAPVQTLPVRSNNWRKIAAAIALIIGLGAAMYWFYGNRPPEELLAVATDRIVNDTLPDGSTVTLNKASSLSYPSRFNGQQRAVKLTGEAFFHVTPDKKKPFVIAVNDIQVTVVGTSFNIKTDNGFTDVVVETGIVRVTRNGQTIELHANERLRAGERDTLVKETVHDKLYNYYRTKEFICDDTPLWKLVETLNEAYRSNIVIGREELRNQRINIILKNESLDRVLELIATTMNARVSQRNDQLIIE